MTFATVRDRGTYGWRLLDQTLRMARWRREYEVHTFRFMGRITRVMTSEDAPMDAESNRWWWRVVVAVVLVAFFAGITALVVHVR